MNTELKNTNLSSNDAKPMLGAVRYQFHYKDEFGNMGSKIIKIKERDSELAIATFESIYPNIVWRSLRAL